MQIGLFYNPELEDNCIHSIWVETLRDAIIIGVSNVMEKAGAGSIEYDNYKHAIEARASCGFFPFDAIPPLISATPTPCPLLHLSSYLKLCGRSGRNCILSSPVLSGYNGSPDTRFSRGTTRPMSLPDEERC